MAREELKWHNIDDQEKYSLDQKPISTEGSRLGQCPFRCRPNYVTLVGKLGPVGV
jgi:hypothetical protein